jgi:HEAT repeat protein
LSVIVILLGLAGVWWGVAVPKPAEEQPAPSGTSTAGAAPAPEQLPTQKAADGKRAWIPGTLYRYGLLLDQKVTFENKEKTEAAAKATPSGMKINLQGGWDVGVVSVDNDHVETRVQLRPDSFSILINERDQMDPAGLRQLKEVIGLPFFVTFDKNGLAKRTYFEKKVDVLGRGILRALVGSTQLMVPGVPQDSWQSEEHDPTGKYLSTYRRQAAARFEKQKQAYTHMSMPQGQVPVGKDITINVRSSVIFELAEDLWAQSLDDSERLEIDLGDKMPTSTNELKLSLRLLERRKDPSLLGSLTARRDLLDSSPMSSFLGLHEDPLDQYRQILGDRTFSDVLEMLRSLPKEEGERNTARTLAMEYLRAIFMLQPAEALKIPNLIKGMEPDAASPMLGALSAASTSQSIQALSQVSRDYSLSKDVRMDAVAALGVTPEPNKLGVDTLRDLIRTERDPMMRDTATLAFGNAAYQMSDTNAPGAQTLVSELQNDYRTGATPDQQAMALRALGNTQSPSTLATLEEALRSPNLIIREAAVTALRNIADPAADRLLSERLLSDPASEVRRAVLFAASFRPLAPLIPALGRALQTDASQGVRSDLVQLLGANRNAEPAVLPLLVWASQNDAHPDIREAALVYVKASSQSPSPTP